MRNFVRDCFTTAVFIAVLSLIHTGSVSAQTFKTIYNLGINEQFPVAPVTLSGNVLYGTSFDGHTNGGVFRVNVDGTSFTNLYYFTVPNTATTPNWINSDGIYPYSNLILSGNALYGMTQQAGTAGAGTVFKIDTNGNSFADLNNFSNYPSAHLYHNYSAVIILTNNMLFGTAVNGGKYSYGTVFQCTTSGSSSFTLHTFTNSTTEGAYPAAGVILGTNFYGIASLGGSSGNGTIFKVSTNGIGFAVLHSFTATSGASHTNVDGSIPDSLTVSGNTLYGAATLGGSSGNGAIFRINSDGSGFTNLYSFSVATGGFYPTNSDGVNPQCGLMLSGNTLYGTAYGGGPFGNGTVFSLTTNGTGFTTLYSFSPRVGSGLVYTNTDGAFPQSGLILSSNVLYGTTSDSGSFSGGTIFSLTLPPPPQLTVGLSGANLILTWPTNGSGFTLQSATNLSNASWSSNSPAPIIINGQNCVTNPISGPEMFYRLGM